MGITNRGKWLICEWVFRGVALPANFYVALATSTTAPTADTNTLAELTEIAAGNGYTTGGYSLTPNTTDFSVHTENDTDNRNELRIKDVIWTAAGGPIPASGNGARYAMLTTDDVTVGSRKVIAWWDLLSDRSALDGQILPLIGLELRGQEPA